jgi:predicted ribosome quality control (RQC) complex YloA/Tae2 family protein
MTKEFNITNYPCAAGGCLLTDKEFANKLSDLFQHKKRITIKEVNLLKVGRHFRFGANKIIVGRNETENGFLLQTKQKADFYFEVPNCGSPITILKGPLTNQAIEKAAALTAFHSDKKLQEVLVSYGQTKPNKAVTVFVPSLAEVNALRI